VTSNGSWRRAGSSGDLAGEGIGLITDGYPRTDERSHVGYEIEIVYCVP